jgi:hypothetical protein
LTCCPLFHPHLHPNLLYGVPSLSSQEGFTKGQFFFHLFSYKVLPDGDKLISNLIVPLTPPSFERIVLVLVYLDGYCLYQILAPIIAP